MHSCDGKIQSWSSKHYSLQHCALKVIVYSLPLCRTKQNDATYEKTLELNCAIFSGRYSSIFEIKMHQGTGNNKKSFTLRRASSSAFLLASSSSLLASSISLAFANTACLCSSSFRSLSSSSSLLSLASSSAYWKGRQICALTLYNLTSVCIFSILFSIHFLMWRLVIISLILATLMRDSGMTL